MNNMVYSRYYDPRLIDAYELPYLDPVSRKLLPGDVVMHLTKHNIQALSPFVSLSITADFRWVEIVTAACSKCDDATWPRITTLETDVFVLWHFHPGSERSAYFVASCFSRFMRHTYVSPGISVVSYDVMSYSATLYMLTKRLAHILTLPLTLHHTLAPGLERLTAHDPLRHSYDNAPPEVSFVSAAIMVLKMVYGLDGRPR